MGNSNRHIQRYSVPGGFTVIYYRKEDLWELHEHPYGKMSKKELTRLLCNMINIPQHELALAYTELLHFHPQAVRAEFGQNGQFLYVA